MEPAVSADGDPLHDAAYRYAFRRSSSNSLASRAAREALEDVPDPTDETAVIEAARTALRRYLPPGRSPTLQDFPAVAFALAELPPNERELLLLHHWEGFDRRKAGSLCGVDPERLDAVVAAFCALLEAAGYGPTTGSASPPSNGVEYLRLADPARSISAEDLAGSRRRMAAGVDVPGRAGSARSASDGVSAGESAGASDGTGAAGIIAALPGTAAEDPADGGTDSEGDTTRDHGENRTGGRSPDGARRHRSAQTVVGLICLAAVVVALATALIPTAPPEPGEETARLFEESDVVAVVDVLDTESQLVDGDVRIIQTATVVQVIKGDDLTAEDPLTFDATGRSTSGRPFSRNLFPPYQLVFLDRTDEGLLALKEGDGAVLTLVDLQEPAAATVTGAAAVLPSQLTEAIDALPAERLALNTSDQPPGSLDLEAIVGIRPAVGRDDQNLPGNLLGSFRMSREEPGDTVCSWFEFNGRSVLLRWPQGFSAYDREQTMFYADGDPQVDRRVLTVLNERGYPYVDENRSTPFIRGVPTGERGTCGGQYLEVWDIAITPGNTLLNY